MNNKLTKTSKIICGHDYEIMAFPAIYNFNLFKKFGATVGESFKSIFSVIDDKGLAGLGEGIYSLLNALYTKDPKCELVLELLSQTTRDGKAINRSTFDEFYTGNTEEMIEILKESIIVHFKGFLPTGQLFGLRTTKETVITENLEN